MIVKESNIYHSYFQDIDLMKDFVPYRTLNLFSTIVNKSITKEGWYDALSHSCNLKNNLIYVI